MTPGLSYKATGNGISARIPGGLDFTALHHPVAREGAIFEELPKVEEPPGVVKDKPGVQFQLGDPARRLAAIKVDFPRAGSGKIMREALEVERCLATYGEWAFQQRLKRDDHMLPAEALILAGRGQLGRRAPIYAARHPTEPAMRDVLAPQGAGIAVALKPGGVNKEPLGKIDLQPV
jgi:hypothetical protein